MVDASALKRDNLVKIDGELFQVVEATFNRMQQRRAIVTARLKSLKTGSVLEKKFRSDEKVEDVFLEKRDLEYLYRDGAFHVFMDMQTYEEFRMDEKVLGDQINYLVPNIQTTVRFYEGTALSVQLPTAVNLAVRECDPALKGATAAAQYKPAILETGMKIMVPPFVSPGDVISVDTRDGQYLSRATTGTP
ncbi:MAG: elongation factor P [Planctomycetota bacterium]